MLCLSTISSIPYEGFVVPRVLCAKSAFVPTIRTGRGPLKRSSSRVCRMVDVVDVVVVVVVVPSLALAGDMVALSASSSLRHLKLSVLRTSLIHFPRFMYDLLFDRSCTRINPVRFAC